MTPSFAREVNAVATVSDLVMVEAPLVVDDMVAEPVYARENLSCFVAGEGRGPKALLRFSTLWFRLSTRWVLRQRAARARLIPFRLPRR